jgi:tetratricopeptide (TPR) repeat protein
MRFRLLAPLAILSLVASCSSPKGPKDGDQPPAIAPELQALEDARVLLLESNPEDALLELDLALNLQGAEQKAEVQFLRGVATLQMGTNMGAPIFFEDSRRAFVESAPLRPSAYFGAARATWMQYFQDNDPQTLEQALTFVRKGAKLRTKRQLGEKFFANSPERTWGEIAFSAFTASKSQDMPEARTTALFNEALDALEAEIGNASTKPWGWTQVANLYLWDGRRADARMTIATGLDLIPTDEALHKTNVRLAEEDGGWAEVVRVYEEFVQKHDGCALGHWYLGQALYDLSIENLRAEKEDRAKEFSAAIRHFERCRVLNPDYADATRGYEIVGRSGLAWSHYNAGRLVEATKAFWSMEDFVEGGLHHLDEGRVPTGLDSMAYVIFAHNTEWEKGRDDATTKGYDKGFPHLRRAANLANRCYEYAPEDWNRANNAGYFSRDLAVELQRQGVVRLGVNVEVSAKFFASSNDYMEKSYLAYEAASKLAPNDARTINDTGLILAYYLQRNPERASECFREALRLGLLRLKDPKLEPDEKETVTEAVGDAYQNLGVLALTLGGNAARALPYFENSLNYEISEREEVRNYYRPLCKKVIAGEIDPLLVVQANAWGTLSNESVAKQSAAEDKLTAALETE